MLQMFFQAAGGLRAGVLGKWGILCENQFFVEVNVLPMSTQPQAQREIACPCVPDTWRRISKVSKIKPADVSSVS